MRFSFTGACKFNDMASKNPPIRSGKTANGANYKSVSFSVVDADNNRGYVELFGTQPTDNVIKSTATDGSNMTINWEDRFDNDVIEQVASYKKHVFTVDGEDRIFITDWDAVEFIEENMENLSNVAINVTGNVTKTEYNGNISNHYRIQNLRTNTTAKQKLRLLGDFYFLEDSIDSDAWAETKMIYINGYTREYLAGKNCYAPCQFVLDASRVNFENENHVKKTDFMLSMLGLKRSSSSIKWALKKNSIYKMGVTVSYINGAKTINEIKLEDLSETQRRAVESGFKTLEDFAPGRNGNPLAYGERITMYSIADFTLANDYIDGPVMLDIDTEEFFDSIYKSAEESVDDAITTVTVSDDLDDDDIFG